MTSGAVLGQLTRPTARSMAWSPVVAVTAGLLLLAFLLRLADRPADVALGLGAGAVAAAVVFALHDPAAALLAPVPTSTMTRRLLRVALVTALVLPAWLLTAELLPGPGLGLLPLLALASTGVAVAVWLPSGRSVTLAAAVPLVWVTAGQLLGVGLGPVGEAVGWWHTHPVYVAAVALALLVAGRTR
jgi:hypothetical protein